MKITVPRFDGSDLTFDIEPGQIVFVLGANGTGKSSLMRHISRLDPNAKRIAAHRSNMFLSDKPGISPQDKANHEAAMRSSDTREDSRWKDDYGAQRPMLSLYDLIDAENVLARDVKSAVVRKQDAEVQALLERGSPLDRLNRLLLLSNIQVRLSIDESSQVVATRDAHSPYSVARLSDGERNAVLLASDVLTAKPGTFIAIDEPERHLHRSIIAPLLTQLLNRRDDLPFLVSTHDVSLPMSGANTRVLLLRGCKFSGFEPQAWDCDLITTKDLPDDIKADVLGARREILFVEGTDASLDKPLYAAVFPNVSVIAKDSCADVEHCVKGARGTREMHWLKAWGIVDGDFSDPVARERLEKHGIYALPFHSVESIYYHPAIQERVSARKTADASKVRLDLKSAADATLKCFDRHLPRMAARSVERKLREEIKFSIPGQAAVASMNPISISIDVKARVQEEAAHLEELVKAANVTELITKFPVRETGALIEIAMALGFRDRVDYERSVLAALLEDATALADLKRLLGAAAEGIKN